MPILLLIMCFVTLHIQAQTRAEKYPLKTHGLELSFLLVDVNNSNGFTYSYDLGPGFNGKWLYEYQINRYVGIQSGAGLEFRGYQRRVSLNDYETHPIFALQVPAQVQFWPFHFLAIETGVKANLFVLNRPTSDSFNPNPVDLLGTFGLRFKLDRALSIGFGLDWGFTPFQKIPTQSEAVSSYHRGAFFNFRYMFYGEGVPL
jgi:hypothetical protein